MFSVKLLGAIALILSFFSPAYAADTEYRVGDLVSVKRKVFCISEEHAKDIVHTRQISGKVQANNVFLKYDDCQFGRAVFKIIRVVEVVGMPDGRTVTIIEVDVGESVHVFTFMTEKVLDGQPV
ncbi:MAG: hypothetical protein WAV21_03640 [Minisyncoccia bacterium]